MKNSYTEKEKLIFSGVIKLAESGEKIEEMTAKQIADAAGVGKATIYDYFSSKDEIIANAILYCQQSEMKRFSDYINTLPTFKDKVYSVYESVMESVDNSASIFNLVVGFGTPKKVLERANISPEEQDEIFKPFFEMFYKLIEFDNNTGRINADIDTEEGKKYFRMTLFANLCTVGRERMLKEIPKDIILANAYKMLVKAFN